MSGSNDYEPYESNYVGLIGLLIDLKTTIAGKQVYSIAGFTAPAFEDVVAGEALYSRTSDGKVGKAIANDTVDKATCVGFAQTSKSTGQDVRCLTHGQLATSGLTAGVDYYLSTGAGGITMTPPSGSGKYFTKVGRASSTTQLIVKIEAPVVRN